MTQKLRQPIRDVPMRDERCTRRVQTTTLPQKISNKMTTGQASPTLTTAPESNYADTDKFPPTVKCETVSPLLDIRQDRRRSPAAQQASEPSPSTYSCADFLKRLATKIHQQMVFAMGTQRLQARHTQIEQQQSIAFASTIVKIIQPSTQVQRAFRSSPQK